MVLKYGEKATLVVEDLGASPIAERFGVDKYPAVFVDEALVARPEDFYGWGGTAKGRYMPWSEVENRKRFQNDLARMIDIRLAGGELVSRPGVKAPNAERNLPSMEVTDLDGRKFQFDRSGDKPVLIEMWAPWCPHCITTLKWMKTLDPSTVTIIAVAVESERADILRAVEEFGIPGHVVIASDELHEALDPPALPTLLIADRNGRIVRSIYGAPPGLHDQVMAELAKLR